MIRPPFACVLPSFFAAFLFPAVSAGTLQAQQFPTSQDTYVSLDQANLGALHGYATSVVVDANDEGLISFNLSSLPSTRHRFSSHPGHRHLLHQSAQHLRPGLASARMKHPFQRGHHQRLQPSQLHRPPSPLSLRLCIQLLHHRRHHPACPVLDLEPFHQQWLRPHDELRQCQLRQQGKHLHQPLRRTQHPPQRPRQPSELREPQAQQELPEPRETDIAGSHRLRPGPLAPLVLPAPRELPAATGIGTAGNTGVYRSFTGATGIASSAGATGATGAGVAGATGTAVSFTGATGVAESTGATGAHRPSGAGIARAQQAPPVPQGATGATGVSPVQQASRASPGATGIPGLQPAHTGSNGRHRWSRRPRCRSPYSATRSLRRRLGRHRTTVAIGTLPTQRASIAVRLPRQRQRGPQRLQDTSSSPLPWTAHRIGIVDRSITRTPKTATGGYRCSNPSL